MFLTLCALVKTVESKFLYNFENKINYNLKYCREINIFLLSFNVLTSTRGFYFINNDNSGF